ncbi:MAG TPA: tetratricopeptide repeat protein [Anaeromyxobacter sp.]|nr:tetratricopeptide repeat protein [Anaeromyxobacter sp.]
MLRAAVALLVLACAAAAHAAPRRQADPDAMREVRRGAAARWASSRAISHYLEARRNARAGNLEKAAEHFRLAVAYDEESPELRTSLAEALAAIGQLDPAEGEARRALDLARDGPAAVEAHVLLGRIATARRRPEQAIASYRQAVRAETALAEGAGPPDPGPWRLLAAAYAANGDEDAATRTLDDLATRRPGDGSGFRELGRTYLDKREPARAERHLRRAVQLDGRDAEAYRLLAQAHEALRRAPDARDDLVAILRTDPDDGQALLSLGRMAARQGDVPQAREWFLRHVRASPDTTDAYVRVVFQWLEVHDGGEALGVAHAAVKEVGDDPRIRFAEALALQEQRRWGESADVLGAIKIESGELFVSARVALADALSHAGRHAEAERALAAPLASFPDDARVLMMRAAVLDRAGRAPDAVALLRKAIADRERKRKLDDLPDLYSALADSLVRARRTDEAVTALRGALRARPSDEVLLYALGSAYERAGQQDAAIAQMRAILALNPDHAEAMNFMGYSLAEQGVRLDEAEQLVRRALELKPRSGHVLDSLGWVLYRRGDLRRAVEMLEQADQRAGPDATILEHLGDAYRAMSRLQDAARAYRRALGSVPDEPPADQVPHKETLERKLRDVSASADRAH